MRTGVSATVGFPAAAGLRLNHAAYVQQQLTWKRLTAIAGVRYVHNQTFGDKAVPRVALSLLALKGGEVILGDAPALFLCHRNQGSAL